MAAGGELIIDDKLLKLLYNVDKKLEKIAKTSGSAQANIFKMFDKTGSQGVDGLIRKLQQLEKYYSTIGQNDSRGMKRIANDARKTADEINKLIAAVQQRWTPNFKGAMNYSQNAKTLSQDREAINRLRQARETLSRTDSDYSKKLSQINGAIAVHSSRLRAATQSSHELSTAHRGLMDTSGQLMRQLTLVFSVSQIKGYVDKVVQVRKEFELQQKALTAIIRDQNKANQLWNKTVALAVKSPFRVKELVTYTKQLAAYRIETEKLNDTTKMLADISAGLGVDMNRLILAYGQVRAAEFLRGTELRQFTEAGIPMLEELANHFSELEGRAVSTADVFERISKRMVVFADVEAVFRKITSEGGTFYKMQEKQSETLYGTIANLHDSIDLMLNDIGKSNEGVLKAGLSQVKWLVEHWELLAEAIKGVAAALVIYKVRALAAKASVIEFAIAQGIASGTQALKFTELLAVGWRKVGMAISAAKTALLSNPITAIVLAATYAVSKLYFAWRDHNKQMEQVVEKYKELRGEVSNIDVRFAYAKDNKKRRQELRKLVEEAGEYGIPIKFKVDEVDDKDLGKTFATLRNDIASTIDFIAEFETKINESDSWLNPFDNIEDSFKKVSKAAGGLNTVYANGRKNLINWLNESGKLTDDIKEKLADRGEYIENETELQYIERLNSAYTEYLDTIGLSAKELLKVGARGASDLRAKWKGVWGEELYNHIENAKRGIAQYEAALKKAGNEFAEFAKTLDIPSVLTQEEKEIRLKAAIDKQGYDEYKRDLFYRLASEEWKVNIVPTIPEEEEDNGWKTRVKSAVEKLNKKIKASLPEDSKIRLFSLPSDTDTKESWLNKFKSDIEEAKRVYQDGQAVFDEHDVARTNALKDYSREAEQIANIAPKTTKEERDALKLMQERIALIKEMHSEYNKLRKHYSDEEAQLKVINAYSKSFKDAFGDWNIDMFRNVIDAQTLDQFHQLGTISDEVLEKIKQLADNGTYIRSFSDDFVDSIKKAEGFHDKAYKGDDNVWTIGYGETKGVKQGQTITQEAADLQLRTRLANDFKVQLNEILDKNKDLILTQEQYNALLDLSYQGGAGMVSRLIYLARNMDKSIEHVSNIQQKIGGVFGEEAAARFGDSFVQQLKDGENIYQRIALLLQTMNLTVRQGQISEKYYKGMQARSDKRSEWFATGKDISSVIASVTKQFKNVDVSTKKGIVTFLESLAPIAAKEGEKVTEELNKAIDGFKAEIGIEMKITKEEALIRQVEDMFGTYELSLELKDMNIPTDIAEKLFGFESLDLEGLKEKLKELEPQFIGTDQEKKYRDYLQKVEEMEAKTLEERMKKYTKFLEQEQTERVKIKLNEVRQLMEIEDTFRIHEKDAREKFGITNDQWKLYEEQRKKGEEINMVFLTDLGIAKDKAQAILEQNQLLTAQAQIARAGVTRVTQEDLDKNAWEEFKKSSYYETLFADMEYSGTKSLRNLRDKIVDMKDELKHLPPEVYKQVVEAIEKIENELDNRNPLGALFDAWEDLRELSKKGVTIKTTDGEDINVRSRDKISERLRVENESLEQNREEIALRKQFLHANEQIRRQLLEENSTLRDGLDAHRNIDDVLSEQITKLEEECEIYEENIKQLSTQEGRYRMIEARARNAQKGIQEWANATNDLIGSVDSLLDAFGLAEDSQARIWLKASMGIVDTIASVAQLIIQFTIMEVAANSALGIIGYIAMALKAIATLFATLFGNPDEELQKQIEAIQVQVEALDRKFQKLEKSIKNAMGVADVNMFTQDAINNLEEQNRALSQMIELEKNKKDTDESNLREWANEIEDNIEEIERLRAERIKELGGIGDAEGIKSAAQEFTDAWLQAFLETGDGLTGLEDKFKEFATNLIKSQLMHRVTEGLIRPITDKIDNIVGLDGIVTDIEWQDLMQLWNDQKIDINNRLRALVEQLGDLDALSSSAELDGLQKGIQGIQESTAQEVVSYMNSLRTLIAQRETFYKNNEQLSSIMNSILVDGINPMLDQLRVIANNTESIHTLLDSVVRAGHSQGGYGIKVFSD